MGINYLEILLLLLIPFIICEIHSKSKCSLECYALCMRSGTPSAAICNCPVADDSKNCGIFENDLKSANILGNVPKIKSEYMDAHMIKISMDPQPAVFSYIFEYSTISTEPDQWNFAGASPTPETIFSILDPCRDYQFRVIMVLRSTDPSHIFDILKPKPITVQLPPFVLHQEQIKIDLPRIANTSNDQLKMYVKWSVPRGYVDADVYGYESPVLYPIQCSTPEGELPQPRIEIIKGGGRLAVELPATILESRCRMWVEVRMVPRCVRLEPFNIQKNVEIDCSKNPDLEVCSRDSNPICYENLEISGERGKARVTWDHPTNKPIYYHVRYGPAQSKRTDPFVSWQLAAKREIRVDGSLNTFTLDIPEDEDFGVQVCAILSTKRKRPKFGVVRVIPFQCSSCKSSQNEASTRCGDCSAILGSAILEKDWIDKAPKKSDPEFLPKHNATVYRIETDLAVGSHPHHSVAKSDTRHSTDSPIELEKAVEINKEQESTTQSSSSENTTMEMSGAGEEDLEVRKILSEQIGKSIEQLEKTIRDVENEDDIVVASNSTGIDEELETKLEEAARQLQDTLTSLVGNSTELRHHEKTKKCLTSDGIVCEFGCEDRKTCICPVITHARLRNGICANRDSVLHTICFPRKEINATWDSESGNVMVRRNDALYHIKNAENVDKLFVEFGEVSITENENNDTEIEFNEFTRNKIVVLIQTLLKSSVFSTEPFIFHVNQTIDINTTYGMRFCVFNSSQIKNPHNYDWDDVSKFEQDEQIAEVIQVSPVRFTNKLQLNQIGLDTYWSTVATVVKIAILVVLAIAMFILIYLNCTKIKMLYDRKRTHYFRPFYIDPAIHLSNSMPSPTSSGFKRESSRGYYDVRSSHLIM